MSLIVKPWTFSAGATIIASEHNNNFDIIYADYNGNITNSNIASGAAIADSKLAQITTASKVSGSALTSLASITSAGGIIPAANTVIIDLASTTTGGVKGVLPTLQGGTATTANSNAANGICILNASAVVATTQGGSGVAGKTYHTGTYTGTLADQLVAHSLGAAPTYLLLCRSDGLGASPQVWLNGMGTSTISHDGTILTNEFTAVPDATNIKFKGNSFTNTDSAVYYYLAIVGQ